MQFLNNIYQRPIYSQDPKTCKYQETQKDFLITIYRDRATGKKHLERIIEPRYTFYVANSNLTYHHNLYPIDKCSSVTCKFKDLKKKIMEIAGEEDDFYEYKRRGNTAAINKRILQYHWLFSSDMDINDYGKKEFLTKHPPESSDIITKGFFDIEVDSSMIQGFPEEDEAKCPVNAISYIYQPENKLVEFLLDYSDSKNEVIKKATKDFKSNLKNYIKSQEELYDNKYHIEIKFFKDEVDLIGSFLNMVNEDQPDFLGAWNIKYDFNYLKNRLQNLRENPKDYFCHSDFKPNERILYYYEDKLKFTPKERGDYIMCSSYTQWIDQQSIYFQIRSGQGELESNALNFVAELELKDNKIDYTEVADIKTFCYDNYELFVTYSLKDTILLEKLEEKNKDIDLMYNLSIVTQTRFHKTLKKTISIKNLAWKYYYDNGFIMGNNINANNGDDEDDDKPKEKFSGAFVLDPNNNLHMGKYVFGKRSKFIFDDVIDLDLASLYPSIFRAFNIDATTQYGRLLFKDSPPTKEYDAGGMFVNDMETQDYIAIGSKWFMLPTTNEILTKLENK